MHDDGSAESFIETLLMAIQVTCSGCHARFKVSDKYAGRKGPCPKCKAEITVPDAAEEVVIKSHDEFGGARDAGGKLVLKPLERKETPLTPLLIGGVILIIAAVCAAVFYIRASFPNGNVPQIYKILGAVLMAPPLAFAGYSFLRDHELEPYRGPSLVLRISICAIVYAILWGALAVTAPFFFGTEPLEIWSEFFLLAPFVVIGTLTSLVTLDLTPTNAFFHYAFYLVTTVVLRLIVRLSAF